MNDYQIIDKEAMINLDRLYEWLTMKITPNFIQLRLDDEDILRLLIFCIEITYQMFTGGTLATTTAKGFRQRRRTFETILVDQFVGKLGEVIFKKFIEKKFNRVKIELDWQISKDIKRYKNDILNAKKLISIKTTPTLAGIWAEADKGYDYGIMVKCVVPQQPILQFFIEVCGFTRLLDFAESRIPNNDIIFKDYIYNTRDRIKKFKCGEIQTSLKGLICGFFKTEDYNPVKVGEKIDYLGEVREERYLVPINKLKWKLLDWQMFLEDNF